MCQNSRVDFARELDVVQSFLGERGFRMAVIGGVALAAYGHPRLTLDLDVVTESAAQDPFVAMMESRGFETLHRSPGYSNHHHAERGRVDVMYVRGETCDRLFAAAKAVTGPQGRSMYVPKPEHLIAMKVQAVRDAPERLWQDLADIGFLLRLDGVDHEEVAAISRAPGSRTGGVSSRNRSDADAIDLVRDVPTTREDIQALRRLRRLHLEGRSWLLLSPAELDAILPRDALNRRPPVSADATPFELP